MRHETRLPPRIITRLKRAHGHLAAVIAMFEEGRPCLDLAQQLHAVESAISNAKRELIHDHIEHCLDETSGRAGPARGAQGTQGAGEISMSARAGNAFSTGSASASARAMRHGDHDHDHGVARPHPRRHRCDDRHDRARHLGDQMVVRDPGDHGAAADRRRGASRAAWRCSPTPSTMSATPTTAIPLWIAFVLARRKPTTTLHLRLRPGRRPRRHRHRADHPVQRASSPATRRSTG